MKKEPATLAEFFDEFIRKHSVTSRDSGMVVLDVTPEECEVLGRNFIYIMVGWAAGLDLSRAKQRGIVLPDWHEPVSITTEEDEEKVLMNEPLH